MGFSWDKETSNSAMDKNQANNLREGARGKFSYLCTIGCVHAYYRMRTVLALLVVGCE